MTDDSRAKKAAGAIIPGSIFWGVIFFIIGLILYQDLYTAFMLGLFAWIATVVMLLYCVPILGIIMYVYSTWIWDWPGVIAGALNVPSGGAAATAWFFPAIVGLIVGIILTVVVVAVIICLVADK